MTDPDISTDCDGRKTGTPDIATEAGLSRHYADVRDRLYRSPAPPPPAPKFRPYRPWTEPAPSVAIPITVSSWPVPVRVMRPDEPPPPPSVQRIIRACAAYYGTTEIDVVSQRRTKDVIRPRQVAMYLATKMTHRSLPEIGRAIGGRDHTTCLHGRDRIARLLETDSELRADVAAIREGLAR